MLRMGTERHPDRSQHGAGRARVDPYGSEITVLYIGGLGRSGSTLLDRMLGSVPGTMAVGELVRLTQRTLVEHERCGCGERFHECPFWSAVLADAYAPADIDAATHRRLQQDVDRTRYIPRLLRPAWFHRAQPDIERYRRLLARLYRGVADVSGASVVIDSSKQVSTAFLLAGIPGVRLHMVHLVRDPRGAAYSWTKQVDKKLEQNDTHLMHRFRPGRSALSWVGWNTAFHAHPVLTGVPVTRVFYERLVADPRTELDRILDDAALGLDRRYPFLGNGWVELGAGHSVGGNPMRFDSGRLELRADTAWREHLPTRSQRAVTALTAPLLAAYGYLRREER